MNLREAILDKYSKEQMHHIVEWVGASQKRFDELFSLFVKGEYRVTQMASWPLSYCVQAHPVFIHSNYPRLVQYLQQPGLHDSVKEMLSACYNMLTFLKHTRAIS